MSKLSDLHIEQQESGESHSPNQCNLCGKIVDERAMQEQCGLSLCISCDGKYSDEELSEKKVESNCIRPSKQREWRKPLSQTPNSL